MATRKPKAATARPARGGPSRYDPKHCDEAIATLAKGHSLAGLAGKLGVDRRTVTNWRHQYPEFDQACERGQMMAIHYWEGEAQRLARTGKGNASVVIFALKNRAPEDWRERIEHTGADGKAIDHSITISFK